MALPPLAPLPPANVRLSLPPVEWEACLDAWITLVDFYTRLPSQQLASTTGRDGTLSEFVPSYYHELARSAPMDDSLTSQKARELQKACFALLYRVLTEQKFSDAFSSWDFLADICHAHMRSAALSRLMNSLWKRKSDILEPMLQKQKATMISVSESSATSVNAELQRLAPVMRASADIGAFFMTGSDFLDGLAELYTKTAAVDLKKPIVSVTYIGLTALVGTEHANVSALSDSLYDLKSQADKQQGASSLLADLVTNTPLLSKLRRTVSGKPAERMSKLLDQLETYRTPSIARPRTHLRRRASKGKGKARQANGELRMHRMSLVTQVQDLFPDLGAGFVLKLLDEYEDNVEQVTAHLLDDTLPAHLNTLGRSEQAPIFDTSVQEDIDRLAPRSTPPPPEPFVPDRRNVFDDDDLLAADTSRLHLGKAERAESDPANKAAIMSALSAFDADDDERDDTYDVEDVGGTVDTTHPDGEPGPAAEVTQEENDAALFTAYKSAPELFGRTFAIRRGQARVAIKKETGMTDEAIEGWAIMLQRDPRRLQKLEQRFGPAAFSGQQGELGRSAYREGTETEDSDAAAEIQGGRGGFRGRGGERGRGGRGGGRGGSVAGASSDPNTANAQKRKEANKGSRANHNRRDQRAKKMARGGFPS